MSLRDIRAMRLHRVPLATLGALSVLLAAGCAPRIPPQQPARPNGATFIVTAYCRGTTTASGARVAPGVVAADPRVFPLGSTIRVAGLGRHDGVYRVLDVGGNIKGQRLDVYMRDCSEAVRFGRRSARASLVRRPAQTRER